MSGPTPEYSGHYYEYIDDLIEREISSHGSFHVGTLLDKWMKRSKADWASRGECHVFIRSWIAAAVERGELTWEFDVVGGRQRRMYTRRPLLRVVPKTPLMLAEEAVLEASVVWTEGGTHADMDALLSAADKYSTLLKTRKHDRD